MGSEILALALRLPANYVEARRALAACDSLDEIADWTSQVEAIAAYAVIAKDDQLLAMAQRIRARAFRRSGELLMQIDAGGERGEKSWKQ